ncbi:MAG: lamin tail domain-containing protein, partial [Anaerolineales bacterium]|nr:lamin tail domain-containing protein [Anaerolineales bacterium]
MMRSHRKLIYLALLALLLTASWGLGSDAKAATSDLFISEYIEGSSFNKAIEIYNGTGSAVDLAAGNYTLELYSNGAASPTASMALTGTIADGDVYVLAHASADPAILAEADVTNSSVINFNGDDAVVLRKDGAVVDAFGQVGFDPGSQWAGGGQDDTLQRLESVCAGDTNPDDAFDASAEWVVLPQNTFTGLGSHTANCGGGPTAPVFIINEVDSDTDGTDILEFVELYDGGVGNSA